MPLTGIANAAIDRVVPDRQDFALGIARYAEADLACYRAQGPRELSERQSQEWDKLLGWGRRRYDVDFATTCELMHVPQPAATIERLTQALVALGPFHLAGLSPLVTIGGSLLAALAVLERQVSPEAAWDAVSIDERWQIERWGADAEAEALLESRRRDFLAAARFLELLD
jgi:chaperone required for assembly of F1-ATPase